MTPKAFIDLKRSIFYQKTDIAPYRSTYAKTTPEQHGLVNAHVKVAKDRPNDYGLIGEARVMRIAQELGLPVMDLKRVGLRSKSTLTAVDVCPTRAMEDASVEERKQAYAHLGQLLAVLHAARFSGAGPVHPFSFPLCGVHFRWDSYFTTKLDEHVHYAQCHSLIDGTEAYYITRVVRKLAASDTAIGHSLLHGDLSDRNLFVSNGEVTAIIDWEDALIGDPVFDLAYWATFHPEELHSSLLDSYFTWTEKPQDFHQRFWVYYLRIALSKLVQHHRRGTPDLQPSIARIKLALTKGICL